MTTKKSDDALYLYDLDPQLAAQLDELCSRYRPLQLAATKIEKDKRAMKPAIEALGRQVFARRKATTVIGLAWQFICVHKETVTLSREKLLQLGVSLDVIEQATERTPRVEYHIRAKKA